MIVVTTCPLCVTLTPLGLHSDDTLSDEDHDHCLKAEFRQRVQRYPVDFSKVAELNQGGNLKEDQTLGP